jgi:thioredoxin reductase (NADPH)
VGASYIALECAGFLAGLGTEVTVMVRSVLLREFDQQMATKVGEYMAQHGVQFIKKCVPTSLKEVEPGSPGKIQVTGKYADGKDYSGQFNTVVFAIGRDACTANIGLDRVRVELSPEDGKVLHLPNEQTSRPHIYAVGDVLADKPELTPVAIQSGRLLARRLCGVSNTLTDYRNVCTTVFTPLEYGCCGLSEEEAVRQYGPENVEVYHSNFWPLEWTLAHRPENACYCKLVCIKSLQERVVGFHYLGPNAGEVTQGYGLGIKLGATKAHFDDLVGIHPTTAETFTTLDITKASGEDPAAKGC